jgi:hypothetical protein
MGEEGHLTRSIAEPTQIIEVEVLQLVRADFLLGELTCTPSRRHELG